MIIVIFGQPHSGKSTLANILTAKPNSCNIDGDLLRELFLNKDYSKEGRIINLNRASDIAHFLNNKSKSEHLIVLSLVYPYEEAREYLNSLTEDVLWVYLTHNEVRGRENFHVSDFDIPVKEKVLHLNTSELSIEECINKISNHEKISSRSIV